MNVGDMIFYLRENRVHSAPILSKMVVENQREDIATTEQRELFNRFGPAGVFYATCHGTIHGHEAFPSKEELLKSL